MICPYVDTRRFPVTWLTLIGFRYNEGTHPSDSVAEDLLGDPKALNPQLHWRIRDTLHHVINRCDLRHERNTHARNS